jgi:hypothetical protein
MHGLAVWVSRLFHPFVVPVPTLLVALRLLGLGWREAAGWTALCVAVAIVPPTALLVAQRVRRGDGDWYVTVREERRALYALGGACLVALLVLLRAAGAPALLVACLVASIAANAIGAALNRLTKVSVHAGSAAGCATLLGWLAPAAAPALAAAVALVGWARLRLGHHTPAQVALGAGVTAACIGAALAWAGGAA